MFQLIYTNQCSGPDVTRFLVIVINHPVQHPVKQLTVVVHELAWASTFHETSMCPPRTGVSV